MNRRGARFVGRAPQLAELRAAFDRAADAQPTTVLISGDAGIGKTRLVGELLDQAAAQGALAATGSCLPAGLPYAPVIGLLRELGRHADHAEAAAQVLAPLAASGGFTVAGEAVKPYSTTPSILADLGKTRLFESVLGFVAELSSHRPLVLAFEDVHWADSASVELLDFLARNATRERLLLVATYRAEDIGRDHPLRLRLAELGRLARVVRIELPGLDGAELTELLTEVLGERPTRDLVDELLARSHGNPFYAEELANAPERAVMPADLHDLVMSRVTVLTEPTQRVLRLMAAVGPSVDHELLVALSTGDDLPELSSLDSAIAEAVDRRVVVIDPSHTTYRFHHALIREAVYASMLPGERIRLHRAIASTLQAQPHVAPSTAGARAAAVADHWWAAGAWEECLAPSLAAAEAASALLAFPEAHRHLEHVLAALERWPDLEPPGGLSRTALLEKASDVAYLALQEERAVALARLAMASLGEHPDPEDLARCHVLLGRNLWSLGDNAGAFAEYHAAAAALPSAEPSWTLAYIYAEEARGLMVMSRNEQSVAMCERAIAVARQVGARALEGHALNTLGCARAFLGFIDEGIGLLRQAIAIAEEVANAEDLNRGYGNLGALLASAGRLEEAAAVVFDLAATGEDLWGARLEGAAGNSADALIMLGRYDDAKALLSRIGVRALGVCTPSPFRIPFPIELRQGRFDEARRLLERYDELSALLTDVQVRATYYQYVAELALAEGRPDDAWAAIEQALALAVGADDDWVAFDLRLVAVQTLADRAAHARAHRLPVEIDKLVRQAGDLIDEDDLALAATAGRGGQVAARLPSVAAMTRAERSRITTSDPDLWAQAAVGFTELREPYPRAYARWREAEALLGGRSGRARAHESLLEAHRVASQLGAAPLLARIDELAQRARIELAPASTPSPTPADDLGLTPREVEVLTHLVVGRTDQEIADALFISKKTASVHVSNLLRKLGVANRVEAGKVGRAHGLSLAS